jgi:hypothetical protein
MSTFGTPELLVVLALSLSFLIVLWPAARICTRLGLARWLAILSILPVVNLFLLWYVAYAQWPIDGPVASRRMLE